jgi:chemotaxis protein CheZ
MAEVLTTRPELKRFLDPAQRLAADVIEAYRREISAGLPAPRRARRHEGGDQLTKREIATLHRSEAQGKGMRRVSGELDAVVEAHRAGHHHDPGAVEEVETRHMVFAGSGRGRDGTKTGGGRSSTGSSCLYEACTSRTFRASASQIVSVLQFVEELAADDRFLGWLDAFKDLVLAGSRAD